MFCSDSVLAGISVKTAIEAGVAGGAIAASIYLMSKPNSGRIRFSYGKTGIDPDTGKPVKDKYRAYQIYKQLKDNDEIRRWERRLKGQRWRTSHLD